MKIKPIRGCANESGFKISVKIGRNIKEFATKDCKPEQQITRRQILDSILVFILFLISCFFVYLFYQMVGFYPDLWAALIIILFIRSLMEIVANIFLDQKGNTWKQWHACEHKTANLLKEKECKDISLDSLKSASSYHKGCGSIMLVQNFLSTLYLLFALPFAKNPLVVIVAIIGFYYLVESIAYLISHRSLIEEELGLAKQELIIVLLIFICLAALSQYYFDLMIVWLGSFVISNLTIYSKIPYLLQKHIATSEPTEEQYQETMRLIQEIASWQMAWEVISKNIFVEFSDID